MHAHYAAQGTLPGFAPTASPASATGIRVTWPWSAVPAGAAVEVQRSSGGAWVTVASVSDRNAAGFTDTGLALSTAYSYRVRSVLDPAAGAGAGWSGWSAPVTGHTHYPPVFSLLSAATAVQGQTFTLNLRSARANGPVTWHIDWGDGSAVQDVFQADAATAPNPPPTHTYGTPGNYAVSATVTDASSATAIAAGPLALDSTFGTGGTLVTETGNTDQYDSPGSVRLLPGGKVLVSGSTGNGWGLKRFNADGTPDTTFGSAAAGTTLRTGRTDLTWPGGPVNWPYPSMAVEPDGSVVMAGGTGDFLLTRWHPDGTLDTTSFGTDGQGGGTAVVDLGGVDIACGVGVQTGFADGLPRLVVAGDTDGHFAVARLLSTGALDATFGDPDPAHPGQKLGYAVSGITAPAIFGAGADAAIGMALTPAGGSLPAGEIYVTGVADNGAGGAALGLVRFTRDGAVDAAFGNGATAGLATYDTGGNNDIGVSVAVQPDGKAVVGGYTDGAETLARFDTGGGVDAGFHGGQPLRLADEGYGGNFGRAVAVQPDGKVVLTGNGSVGTGFEVVRVNADGSFDNTFGTGGGLALLPVLLGVGPRAGHDQPVGGGVGGQHDRAVHGRRRRGPRHPRLRRRAVGRVGRSVGVRRGRQLFRRRRRPRRQPGPVAERAGRLGRLRRAGLVGHLFLFRPRRRHRHRLDGRLGRRLDRHLLHRAGGDGRVARVRLGHGLHTRRDGVRRGRVLLRRVELPRLRQRGQLLGQPRPGPGRRLAHALLRGGRRVGGQRLAGGLGRRQFRHLLRRRRHRLPRLRRRRFRVPRDGGGALPARPGAGVTALFTADVVNVAPSIQLGGDYAAYEGSPYSMYFSASDPGQDAISRWLVDWGDGTTDTFTTGPIGEGAAGTYPAGQAGAGGTHTYADDSGSSAYAVGVTAFDEDGTGRPAPTSPSSTSRRA